MVRRMTSGYAKPEREAPLRRITAALSPRETFCVDAGIVSPFDD